MELSERYIQKLEKDGYNPVYEQYDEPNKMYATHSHNEEHAMIIVEGSMKVMIDADMKTLQVNDRIIIPSEVEHSVTVGPQGCKYIIGEK